MKLVERFRSQPRHKHPDPAVRLAYVGEIPVDDRDAIGAMAREDDDPRVRRAAVAKLMEPVLLGAIARDDRDEAVRNAALSMLKDIALEAFEGVSESDSLEAVDAVSDSKTLGQIAKESTRDTVALRALSRTTDSHTLGSIARHAVVETARHDALETLGDRGDHAEIVAVAMNSEYKDTALGAIGFVSDRDELEQIATRGKNKSAAKRARSMIREAVERAEQEAALVAEASRRASEAVLAESSSERSEEGVVGSGSNRIEEERRQAEEQREAARREQEEAERARELAAKQEAAERERQQRVLRLTELASEAAAAAAEPELSSARHHFDVVQRDWKRLSAGVTLSEEMTARFAEAEKTIASRESEAHEADARGRREALARLQHLLGRVEPLAARTDVSLKTADRAWLDIRTALGSIPPLPRRQDHDDITHRLKAAQAALVPKIQELREAAEWQRWANVTAQEQLCARMEALSALDNPEAIAHEVRELQQQWRQASDVPRAQADALWRRFKAAHDAVWPRCEAHFAAEAQVRAENLARKTAICERAESLASSSQWIQTAEEIKRLQGEWKTIGPIARGQEKAMWDRFRVACDRFFTRRREDLVQRKSLWAENLAKKEALCVRAEAVAESTEWEAAAAEIRKLQTEWRSIGPVKKSRSEAIWQRFRGACDRFFARHAERHATARAERIAAREAICAQVESLSESSSPQAEPADLLAAVRGLRDRWQQEISARGVEPDRARSLDQRFAAALARLVASRPDVFGGSDLDPDANRKRMDTLARRMEELAASLGIASGASSDDSALSPTTRLAAMLKEALAANTIGGKVDDESRFRAALEDVRHAQAGWARIGPVPDELRRPISDRFQRACRQIMEKAGQRRSN